MGNIKQAFDATYRDHVVDGVLSSGKHEPAKRDIRQVGALVDNALTQLAGAFVADAATVIYAAQATLFANLAPADRSFGIVYDDGTNNGVYIKNGAAGSGSWTFTGLMAVGPEGDPGEDGRSFYQVALDTGYVAPGTTEEQFVDAVVGEIIAAAGLEADRAGTEADRAEAERIAAQAALAAALIAINEQVPNATGLLEGESAGFALDATSEITGSAVYGVNGSGTLSSSLDAFLTNSMFPAAKWTVQADGSLAQTPAGSPAYDWTLGTRALLLEPGCFYSSLWSDNLTNAVWTKSAMTAAFNPADGPHKQGATTLNATGANATILQSVVDPFPVHNFQAYVRRVAGSGPIEMTADGGATWTPIDVTSAHRRFSLNRTGTNPIIGFRIVTSGDVIEVCLALSARDKAFPTSPMITQAEQVVRSGDSFDLNIVGDLGMAGTELSGYIAFTKHSDPGADNATASVGLFGPSSHRLLMLVGNPDYSGVQSFDGALLGTTISDYERGVMQEFTFATGDGGGSTVTVNGEGSVYLPGQNPAVTTLVVSSSEVPVWLHKIVVVPRVVADDDLRAWRAPGRDPRFIADVVVARAGNGGENRMRYPIVEWLWDSKGSIGLIVCHSERNGAGAVSDNEMPTRVKYRRYVFDKVTQKLTPLGPDSILYQPPNWATSYALANGGSPMKVRHGPHKGRLLIPFYANENMAATQYPEVYNSIFLVKSDDNGATMSAASKIIDPDAVFGPPTTYSEIAVSDNGSYVQFADGPYQNRLVIPLQCVPKNQFVCAWTEDGGDTWVTGTVISGLPIGELSEPNIAPLANGDLVMTLRRETVGFQNVRYWLKSINGGRDWTWQGEVGGAQNFQRSNYSLEQVAPNGERGGVAGLLYMAGPSTLRPGVRNGFTIHEVTGPSLSSKSGYEPFSSWRYIGYSSLRLTPSGHLVMAYETGTSSFNVNETAHLAVMLDS